MLLPQQRRKRLLLPSSGSSRGLFFFLCGFVGTETASFTTNRVEFCWLRCTTSSCVVIFVGIFSWFSSTSLNMSLCCWMRGSSRVCSHLEVVAEDSSPSSDCDFRLERMVVVLSEEASLLKESHCPRSLERLQCVLILSYRCVNWNQMILQSLDSWTNSCDGGRLAFGVSLSSFSLNFLYKEVSVDSYGGGTCNQKRLRLKNV